MKFITSYSEAFLSPNPTRYIEYSLIDDIFTEIKDNFKVDEEDHYNQSRILFGLKRRSAIISYNIYIPENKMELFKKLENSALNRITSFIYDVPHSSLSKILVPDLYNLEIEILYYNFVD